MRYFTKVKDDLNFIALRHQLEQQPELWGQFGQRKHAPGSPHAQMTDIWVRYNGIENLGPHFNDEHDSVWYPAYAKLPALKDTIFPLMADVEGERLGGVLITKIPPGCGINPHTDKSWHVDYYDKFYLSISSARGAVFECATDDGGVETLNPLNGEIWRFDNRNLHWVRNNSNEDRITLIVCIRTEKYKNVPAA